MTKRLLIDIDGVVADWGREWDRHVLNYPGLGLPTTDLQTSFDLYLGLSDAGRQAVNDIMEMPEFYANLDPLVGSVEGLNEMLEAGHDVRLVTSPWITNPTCASDKLAWADRVIGSGWAKRTIITSDKTLIRGDILIDDKPEITGSMIPEWEHVLFTQPYNRELTEQRRVHSLLDWRSLL